MFALLRRGLLGILGQIVALTGTFEATIVKCHKFGGSLAHHASQGQVMRTLLLVLRHVMLDRILIVTNARIHGQVHEQILVLHLV